MTYDEMLAAFKAAKATSSLPTDRLERAKLLFGEAWVASYELKAHLDEHVRERTWRERLLSWPWRPWERWHVFKRWTPEEVEALRTRFRAWRDARH